MRKSKAIALSLLGFGTAGIVGGCGGNANNDAPIAPPPPNAGVAGNPADPPEPTEIVFNPDDTWFDEHGNPIEKVWVEGPDGVNRPVQNPHDRLGRPWVKDENGELVPQPPATVSSRPVLGGIMFLYIPGIGGRPGAILSPPQGGVTALKPGMPGVARGGFGTLGSRVTPGS